MKILAFGIAKEIVGATEFTLVPDNADTVGSLRTQLNNMFPRLLKLNSYLLAVNDEYAGEDLVLQPNDEIAIIPPVSGG